MSLRAGDPCAARKCDCTLAGRAAGANSHLGHSEDNFCRSACTLTPRWARRYRPMKVEQRGVLFECRSAISNEKMQPRKNSRSMDSRGKSSAATKHGCRSGAANSCRPVRAIADRVGLPFVLGAAGSCRLELWPVAGAHLPARGRTTSYFLGEMVGQVVSARALLVALLCRGDCSTGSEPQLQPNWRRNQDRRPQWPVASWLI